MSTYLLSTFAIFCTKNEEQNPDGKESEENLGTAYTYRILIAPHGAGNLTGVSKAMGWNGMTPLTKVYGQAGWLGMYHFIPIISYLI